MMIVNYVAALELAGCTGCKRCDIVCPSCAITVASKKAAIDGSRCIGCSRCVDNCPEDVIWMAPRDEPMEIRVEFGDEVREAAEALLERAQIPINPQVPVCACSFASYADVAAAVVSGANSLEEVCAATGLRSGCGIYCVTSALRILKAAGADMTPPKGHRWYDLTLSLWDLRGGPLDGAPGSWVREDLEAFDLDETAERPESRRDQA